MSADDCKDNLHSPMTRDDGVVVCKYCGIEKGPEHVRECARPGCGVRLFDPKEKYCQHHEANIIFGVESEDD